MCGNIVNGGKFYFHELSGSASFELHDGQRVGETNCPAKFRNLHEGRDIYYPVKDSKTTFSLSLSFYKKNTIFFCEIYVIGSYSTALHCQTHFIA